MTEPVWREQWKACADLLRVKAIEFDHLAEQAPPRPPEPTQTFLLMNDDDGTVTVLTMCNHCRYLVADIDKHVAMTVSVGSEDDR